MDDFNKKCIDEHNVKRQEHGAENLKWSKECDEAAKAWAKKMADTNYFGHSDTKLGENIAFSQGGTGLTAAKATDMWYNEIYDYDFTLNGPKEKSLVVGHFTQVVWKGTKEAGFGIAKGPNDKSYVCGVYKPAGNYQGQYGENVGKPKSGLPPKPEEKEMEKSQSSDTTGSTTTEDTKFEYVEKDGKKYKVTIITTTTVTKQSNGSTKTSTSTRKKWVEVGDKDVADDVNALTVEDEKQHDGTNNLSDSDINNFSKQLIDGINGYRKKHQVNELKMSSSMQEKAQKHAEAMLKKDDLFGFTGENYGQTLTMKAPRPSGADIAKMWYKGREEYEKKLEDKSAETSYFTQMVWGGSKEIGVGIASNKDGISYIVALYSPSGNIAGEYKSNVKPKIE